MPYLETLPQSSATLITIGLRHTTIYKAQSQLDSYKWKRMGSNTVLIPNYFVLVPLNMSPPFSNVIKC